VVSCYLWAGRAAKVLARAIFSSNNLNQVFLEDVVHIHNFYGRVPFLGGKHHICMLFVRKKQLFMLTDAIRNPERHMRKASHRGSKQQ